MSSSSGPDSPPRANANPLAGGATPWRVFRIRPLTWLLLLAIIGPCAVAQLPQEIGRWRLAAAVRYRAKDQKDAAYRELAAAIDHFPKSPELLLQRAEWRLDDGQREEALADCDKMLNVSEESYMWLLVHSLFLQNTGEFARAVDDWNKIETFSKRSGIPSRATALNGLAYAQALAKVELDDSLKNVNEALELQPDSAAMLDTRGYIYFLQGQHELSLNDLDTAIKGMDQEVEIVRRAVPKDRGLPPTLAKLTTTRPRVLAEIERAPDISTEYARSARAAAVGHYHRAKTLAALDRKGEAENDLAIARKLTGREPDESLF